MFAQDPTRFVKIYFDAKHLDLYIYREYNTYAKRNKEIFDDLYVNKKMITREEQLIADSAKCLVLNLIKCWKPLKTCVPTPSR